MDKLPESYAVRYLHPKSPQGSARSLFEFLSGWLGGPSLYSEKNRLPLTPQLIGPDVDEPYRAVD